MDESFMSNLLSFIGRNNAGIGFYQIARVFGLPGVSYDLPAVLQDLVQDGLVAVSGTDPQGNDLYVLTERGRQALKG